MKTIFQLSALVLLLSFFSFPAFSQKYGELKAEKDGIQIYGKWKPSKCLKKDSPKMLCLTAVSTSEDNLNATYTIAFYMGPKLEEQSPKQEICLKAGKKVKGRNKGMCLVPISIDNEQIESEDFVWEIEELEVNKTELCE